jgi:hypothetical protein
MVFENVENNSPKATQDDTRDILAASALDGAKEAFLAAKHGGSRVDEPGIPHVPGKVYIPNPNEQHHQRPHATLNGVVIG